MSIFSGRSQLLFDFTMLPAIEKYLSEIAEVDIIAKYFLIITAIAGFFFLVFSTILNDLNQIKVEVLKNIL